MTPRKNHKIAEPTPGPWRSSEELAHGSYVSCAVADVTVAWCGTCFVVGKVSYSIASDEAHANAILISLAPEMLEALRAYARGDGADRTALLDAAIVSLRERGLL